MITTVDDFAKGIWERNKNNSVGNLEEMLINGNKFYQFVVKNEFNLLAGGELLPGETRYLVTSNAGTNYLISYLTGDARLEELFSTFKLNIKLVSRKFLGKFILKHWDNCFCNKICNHAL